MIVDRPTEPNQPFKILAPDGITNTHLRDRWLRDITDYGGKYRALRDKYKGIGFLCADADTEGYASNINNDIAAANGYYAQNEFEISLATPGSDELLQQWITGTWLLEDSYYVFIDENDDPLAQPSPDQIPNLHGIAAAGLAMSLVCIYRIKLVTQMLRLCTFGKHGGRPRKAPAPGA